jgi:hypothetical protein
LAWGFYLFSFPQKMTLFTLPPELWTHILSYLNASDICRAKLICWRWCDMVSSAPLRAICEFGDFGSSLSGRRMVENESMRVYIRKNFMGPEDLEYFMVPGLTPLMRVTVEPVRGEWDTYPAGFPLFDTIRQLVADRFGLNSTLIFEPCWLKASRFPERFDIPVFADNQDVERILAEEHDVISPVTHIYRK